MKTEPNFKLTREHHMDHMTKVVPFIVCGYGIHAYIIMGMGHHEFTSTILSVLGGLLVLMIGAFVSYDMKHEVSFFDNHFTVTFLGSTHSVSYSEITEISVKDPEHKFSSMVIKTQTKNFSWYFVDDGQKIKDFVLKNSLGDQRAA